MQDRISPVPTKKINEDNNFWFNQHIKQHY